jgi:asparagine synthase (glutamine-hydrolysing)
LCGIAGILALSSAAPQVTEMAVATMRDTMAHRGPDGAGVWLSADGRVGLGHRRLSIIDLSAAADQPMSDAEGNVWVTFNGEIYNHAELRRELEAAGHRFRTDHSDTEVIVHGFKQWGIACVERFRGMFAFALWDARSKELWLVRDRIGIKPLYWTRHNDRLLFASEIKALLADPSVPRAINEDGLFHYLSFLTTPAPDTLFAGIHKLPGGTWLRIGSDGRVTEKRYWDALANAEDLSGLDEGAISERLIAELRTAVALRKISDVPVGVFLSGGIDSSTNAALFSEGGGTVKTFSVGYDRNYASYTNELDYARRVAGLVGAEYHEVRLTVDDLINFLPRMIELQDEPIADPVCVPVYYVSKLARHNNVIVCQVGEGADELFWGYPNWKLALQLQHLSDRLPVPAVLRKLGLFGLRLLGKDKVQPYDWLARSAAGQPIFWGGAEGFSHRGKMKIISERMRDRFAGRTSWEAILPIRQRYDQHAKGRGRLDWMTYLDLNFRLPELLLMRVDKMSMGVSLEGRVPFLDHRFVEMAMGIPEAVKTRNGTLKHILKRAVRGIIPDDIIDRPKQGFGVPVHEWLLEKLGPRVEEAVEDFLAHTDYLDKEATRALIRSPNAGPLPWYILNLALWWQRWIKPEML